MESSSTSQQTGSRWRLLLAVGGLILLILAFIAPALLPGNALIPRDIVVEGWPPWQEANQPVTVNNFVLSDIVGYILPVKLFVLDALQSGEFPLWNPYIFAGYPFTYNTQAGLFYPLSLFYYLFPLGTAVDWTIITQMILGGCFMFAYLRQLRLKLLAAVSGSIIFLFNGFMVVWLEWQVVHAAVIWLPLQLLLVERIHLRLTSDRDRLDRGPIMVLAILSGIVFAIPWLGGHWNWTLYTSLTVAFYLLWRLGPWFWQATDWQQRKRILMPVVVIFVIGIGLSLIQVLPAFNYLSQSHRAPMSWAQSNRQGLWGRLVTLIIPNFFGNPMHDNWWGAVNHAETTLYPGLLPLLLAGLTLFLRRDRFTLFFAGWGGISFLLMLGAPFYGILYLLPVFNGLFPSRAAFLVAICVSVLAAFSLDKLLDLNWKSNRRLPIVLATLILMMTALAAGYAYYYRVEVRPTWSYLRLYVGLFTLFLLMGGGLIWLRLRARLSPVWFGLLALFLIVSDLFVSGFGYNTVSPTADLYPETAVAQFLRENLGHQRIVTPAEGVVYPPNSAMAAFIPNMSGYEPGILQRTVDYVAIAEGENPVRHSRVLMPLKALGNPLLDVVGVKYIVSTDDVWQELPVADVAREQGSNWVTLDPDAPVEQLFTMSDAGLHRMDLLLQPDRMAEGEITVRIFTADGVLELAHSTVDIAGVVSGEWHPFYFSAFPSEWGRTFLASVTFAGASGDVQLAGGEGLPVGGESFAFATYYLPRPQLVFEHDKTRVYENAGYFERAFVVPRAIIVPSETEALTAVSDHADQLDTVVILELDGQPAPPDLGEETAVAPGQATIIADKLNSVTVSAVMESAGFLVLADTYYSGWRATVDGETTPLYQADYLLRAVYLPAGEHTVVFSFMPNDFRFGAIISFLTLLICVVGLFGLGWRQRSPGRLV